MLRDFSFGPKGCVIFGFAQEVASFFFWPRSPTVLGRSPTVLGRSPTVLGRSPTVLGRSPTVLGRSRTVLGRSPTVLVYKCVLT